MIENFEYYKTVLIINTKPLVKLFWFLDSPNYTKERDSRQYEQDLKKVLETWNSIPLDEFQRQVIETQVNSFSSFALYLNSFIVGISCHKMEWKFY